MSARVPPWAIGTFHSLSSPMPLLAPKTKEAGNQETTVKAGIFPKMVGTGGR